MKRTVFRLHSRVKRKRKRRSSSRQKLLLGGLIAGWGLAFGLGGLFLKEKDPSDTSSVQAVDSGTLAPRLEANIEIDPRFESLQGAIVQTLESEGMRGSTLAVCILDSNGNEIYGFESDRSIVPASALKTVTSATVLEKFGPDFRFKTLLQGTAEFPKSDAPLEGGVYAGDLVITGGGDPSFTTPTLEAWGSRLVELGIKEIEGKVIGNGQVFPELTASKAWDWGDVGNYYGTPVAGLNLDRNMFQARFRPGEKIGDPATVIDIIPEVSGVEIINLMLTCGNNRHPQDAPYVYSGAYAKTVTFRGAVPLNASEEVLWGAFPDPVLVTAGQFHKILTQRDIEVTHGFTTARELQITGEEWKEDLSNGFMAQSDPLIDLIKHTHKISDNLYAEAMFRLLALEREDRDGQAAVTEYWRERGVELIGLRMEDGSGLARADLIRPFDLAHINYQARRGEHGEQFYGSLTPQFDGKMRWKGGAMSRVRVYAGFTTENAEELAFVVAFNNYDAKSVEIAKARERLMQEILNLAPVDRPGD